MLNNLKCTSVIPTVDAVCGAYVKHKPLILTLHFLYQSCNFNIEGFYIEVDIKVDNFDIAVQNLTFDIDVPSASILRVF